MSDSRKIFYRAKTHNGLPRTDHAIARETVLDALKKYFQPIWGRVRGIRLLAPFLGMKPRHLHGWIYEETGYKDTADRHALCMGTVRALRWWADWAEKHLVETARQEADEIECRERQLSLWKDPVCSQPSVGRRVA